MSNWVKVLDKDLGEILFSIKKVSHMYKSALCNKEPTIVFADEDNGDKDYIAIFQDENERDDYFNKLIIKLV